MPAHFGRALGTVALGAVCYSLYSSHRTPIQSAALKNPFALKHTAAQPLAAIAVLQPDGGSGVTGTVTFRQDSPGAPTHITASVSGLKDGQHGFHVHQFGNLTRGCVTAGPHYNPHNKSHGGMTDTERHVGDMGNVTSKGGKATYDAVDELGLIELSGPTSIIGRAVVVHADMDDLGKGKWEDSKTTGHAGARVACGVIGIDNATS